MTALARDSLTPRSFAGPSVSSFRRSNPGAGVASPAPYNLKRTNTANLWVGLQNVRSGIADTAVGLWGDSTERGRSEANGLDFQRGWYSVMLREAMARGLFNTAWSSLFGTGNLTNGDSRWNDLGAPTHSASLGGGNWSMLAPGDGMNFSPGVPADTFDIYHYDNNSMAFDCNLDGGASTRVDSTTGFRPQRLSGALGLHTVNAAWVASTVRIVGVDAFNSTIKQLKGWNFGVSGAKASDQIATSQPYANGSLATSIAPRLSAAIIGFSINERQGNVLPSDYKSAMQTLIGLIKTGNSNCDVILKTPVPSGSTGLTYDQAAYVAALYELADSNDLPVIRVNEAIGSFASGNARGFYVDTLHLSRAGNDFVGKGVALDFFSRVIAMQSATP